MIYDPFIFHNFKSQYTVMGKTFENIAEAEAYAKKLVIKYKEVVIYKNKKAFSYLFLKNGKIHSQKIYVKE